MSNYKVIEIYFNWKKGMTINIPYDKFLSHCVGFLIVSLGIWIVLKGSSPLIKELIKIYENKKSKN
jgi:large-conductance mechanosensitive channel